MTSDLAFLLFFLLLVLSGCASLADKSGSPLPQPPVAKAVPKKLIRHGHIRIDPYYWLMERDNPEVTAYLEAENDYTSAVMARTKELQETLFQEIKGRIKQTDESVPFRKGDFFYSTRHEEGRDYPVYCRRRISLGGPEAVLLDANERAEGESYYAVRGFSPDALAVSPDQNLLAFAEDKKGRRIYTIRFKNLATGRIVDREIARVTGDMAWANDSRTLFYTKQDLVTLRRFQVFCHIVGTDPSRDRLVYEEEDEEFGVSLFKSRSEKFVVIACKQTSSTEYRLIDADDPGGDPLLFSKREEGHEHSIDHFEDRFLIRTNWKARNFRLMEAGSIGTAKEEWRELIPCRDDVLLDRFEIFNGFLVLTEWKDGLIRIRIKPWKDDGEHYLEFDEPAYSARLGANPECDTSVVRFVYSSLSTPRSTYDYDMVTREKVLKKRDEVLGGFDRGNYAVDRLHAPARDGAAIPLSILYRKGMDRNGKNPFIINGYGSYGYSMDADFRSTIFSLVDRGFIYAIAHVRGGQELGRQWYENGKLLKKKNTFTDFIDCADYLVKEKFTCPAKLFAMGGSAGGLLVGAVINMRPELFKGVVAHVPFVDVVTTMLDTSIPLTTSEYDEWGNPEEKKYYDYMLSYSPYDNVGSSDYPDLLVTAGLHDSQVQYFEPAKWVARLRASKTGGGRILLKTDMTAGHGGASGRDDQYRRTAFAYAFVLGSLGEWE